MKHFVISLFIVAIGLFANVHIALAQGILEESKAKLERVTDLSSDFTYTIQNPNLNPITQAGNLLYKKEKYVIKLQDQELYCNGKILWIHIPEEDPKESEVQKLVYNPEEGINVNAIFNIYESSTKSESQGSEVVHGVNTEKVFLVIQDPELDYNRAYVWINKRTKMLEKVLLIDRRQTQTIFEFSNIKTNIGASDAVFDFDEESFKGTIYDETID